MSDFVVLPPGWDFTPLYRVTLDDLKLFADAGCELDVLKNYEDIDDSSDTNRITVLVERMHDAIQRIAGPDAGEIYAPDDGSTVEQ